MSKRTVTLATILALLGLCAAFLSMALRNDSRMSLEKPLDGLGDSFSMRIEVLDPPLRTVGGVVPPSANPPFWALSPFWALGLNEGDIPKRFSKDYIKAGGEPALGLKAPDGHPLTVFYAIFCEIPAGSFIIVAKVLGDVGDNPSRDMIGASVLKKIDGKWLLNSDMPGIMHLPWNKPDQIKAIIKAGRARPDEFGNLVAY